MNNNFKTLKSEYIVRRNADGSYNFDDAFFSNTFYSQPKLDACLVRVEKDMTTDYNVDLIPCMPDNIDTIDKTVLHINYMTNYREIFHNTCSSSSSLSKSMSCLVLRRHANMIHIIYMI